MARALQLARYGAGYVSPNPMVGAVVVSPDGRIIGEGWHRKYGQAHAEVNAMASISPKDEHLIKDSTIYVTLEPCSHYGKTPPCSLLLIQKGIGRVVVGSPDPFPLVSGRGIKMLREAGIEVVENFMQQECDNLNRRFITAHSLRRPYILLKWAMSKDGFMAAADAEGNLKPVKLSNPVSSVIMHSKRSVYDAIMVGTNTVVIDNPSLTTRLWPGNSPRPVTFKSDRLSQQHIIASREPIFITSSSPQKDNDRLGEEMNRLYTDFGITSLMVEGGAKTLRSFINSNLFDEIRMEISENVIGIGTEAPAVPAGCTLLESKKIGSSLVLEYRKRESKEV